MNAPTPPLVLRLGPAIVLPQVVGGTDQISRTAKGRMQLLGNSCTDDAIKAQPVAIPSYEEPRARSSKPHEIRRSRNFRGFQA
jgi:hypothetical protein